ncbi:microsomal signal peptidase 12 kDa subunit [Sistotremastrum niveocremeum HHB9708]|uniref:Signal peptidase complex subunit 1 n=2 Tax=Sistotremastraceae TaxID=3402574 RepID=A0A164NWL5_9AGAM|nr:microsomal signal peptidase 12 kDa subunit [Sistotremastrum niveocremeum HHB9708]KZT40462.1 microsomal signal peptidase 12 kDa subunit [Sistotremastrum suecicum HHB10207 ss-3]
MNAELQRLLDGKIDFEGQKLATTIMNYIIIASTIIAFFAGWALQSLTVTFGIVGLSTLATGLIVGLPWPFFNKHPVPWLPASSKTKTS